MRLATFIVNNQERHGFVLSHPISGDDWLFDPTLVEARLNLYASRPTSPFSISKPPKNDLGWGISLTEFLITGSAGMDALRRLEDFLLRFLEQSDPYILQGASWSINDVKLCAPIPRPRLFFGLVQNSPAAWRHNSARTHLNVYPMGHQRPQGSVLGPRDPIVFPPVNPIMGGWNPELGVVIGTGGRDIPVSEAMSHVAGLTIVSDVTFNYYRQLVFEQPEPYDWFEDAMSSWGDKKSDARTPMGPYLVTTNEIGNPYDLMIFTRQSGQLRDRSHTGAMHIGIERTISWLSSFRTLYPGDVIHMGTMGYDGSPMLSEIVPTEEDYFESEIERVGVLRNPIVFADSEADWRDPDDVTRKVHPAPAVRHTISQNATQIHQWSVSEARHFWMVFENSQQSESALRPYPRFLNAPATALASHGHRIEIPAHAHTLTLSCELACVVGRLATQVDASDADQYILGYTVMATIQDSSFMDCVIEPASAQERNLPAVYARWADGFNVVQETLKPLQSTETLTYDWKLAIEGMGEVQGNTQDYLMTAPKILAFISRYITLFPGDIVALGPLSGSLTIPANTMILPNITGHAEIEDVGRVEFELNDRRITS